MEESAPQHRSSYRGLLLLLQGEGLMNRVGDGPRNVVILPPVSGFEQAHLLIERIRSLPVRCFSHLVSLEEEFRRNHDLARKPLLAGDSSKGAIGQLVDRPTGIHVIEYVLAFKSNLHVARFRAEADVLQQREIPLAEGGSAHVLQCGAYASDLHIHHGPETGWVEVRRETGGALERMCVRRLRCQTGIRGSTKVGLLSLP